MCLFHDLNKLINLPCTRFAITQIGNSWICTTMTRIFNNLSLLKKASLWASLSAFLFHQLKKNNLEKEITSGTVMVAGTTGRSGGTLSTSNFMTPIKNFTGIGFMSDFLTLMNQANWKAAETEHSNVWLSGRFVCERERGGGRKRDLSLFNFSKNVYRRKNNYSVKYTTKI